MDLDIIENARVAATAIAEHVPLLKMMAESPESKVLAGKVGRRTALGATAAVVAGVGFMKGLSSQDNSRAFYNLATGNPDIDKGIFGRSINPLDFLTPIIPNAVSIAQYGAPGVQSGIPRLLASVRSGMINSKTLSDLSRGSDRPIASDNLRYSNKPPQVNGSMVFGQYNSRYG